MANNSNQHESQHSIYEIPTNITENGKVADIFGWRNAIEAIVIVMITLVLCLRFFNIGLLYTFLLCGLGVIFAIMPYGVNQDTLSTYLWLITKNFFGKRTYRRYVRYKSSLTKKSAQKMEAIAKEDNEIAAIYHEKLEKAGDE